MSEKQLEPLRIPKEYLDKIQEKILELFRTEIYLPLIQELKLKEDILHNSLDDLVSAIASGKIQYVRGHFEGKFSAAVSLELKSRGATWDKLKGTWSIPRKDLPIDAKAAIGTSISKFKATTERLEGRIKKLLPKEISEKVKLGQIFDATLYRVNKSLEKNVKSLTVAPELTPNQRQRIVTEYTENMQLHIQDFTEKQIIRLRKGIEHAAFSGYRRDSLVDLIQDSYSVSENKARFLARQETNLILAKFQQSRYQEAGSREYIWDCVSGTAAHPVRPMHKKLNGKRFSWINPPVVNREGERKNPGQDYGCRCRARAIILF